MLSLPGSLKLKIKLIDVLKIKALRALDFYKVELGFSRFSAVSSSRSWSPAGGAAGLGIPVRNERERDRESGDSSGLGTEQQSVHGHPV